MLSVSVNFEPKLSVKDSVRVKFGRVFMRLSACNLLIKTYSQLEKCSKVCIGIL